MSGSSPPIAVPQRSIFMVLFFGGGGGTRFTINKDGGVDLGVGGGRLRAISALPKIFFSDTVERLKLLLDLFLVKLSFSG